MDQDDFDTLLDIINILESDDVFQPDMILTFEKIPPLNNSTPYPCSFCGKNYFLKGELTRYITGADAEILKKNGTLCKPP